MKRHWYLFIHQLPPKPLYLRAKIRQRLAKIGAVALKNSVYALPVTDDGLEDLQWIGQEAGAGGGEAYLVEADLLDGINDEVLIARFKEDREREYDAVAAELRDVLARRRARSSTNPEQDFHAHTQRARERFERVQAIDFFGARGREEAERLMRTLERRAGPEQRQKAPASRGKPLVVRGATWVTRKGLYVDRIASAWLIRRVIDPSAKFRFIDPKTDSVRPREIGFDMVGGTYTHEAERCTFETLVTRFGIADPAVERIGMIIHDIDLKDAKYGLPETVGVKEVLKGITGSPESSDEDRLDRGFALLDALYRAFKRRRHMAGAPGSAKRPAPTRRRGRSATSYARGGQR